jgi:hypothetical protein
MTGKEQYHALDEIGFIGVQDKRSKAQIKKDMEDTNRYINTLKAKAKRSALKKKTSKTK